LVKNVKAFNSLIQSNRVLSLVILGDFLTGSVTTTVLQIWNQKALLMRNKTSFYLGCHPLLEMIACLQLEMRLKVLPKSMKSQDSRSLIHNSLYLLTHLWQTMQHALDCQYQKRIQAYHWLKTKFNWYWKDWQKMNAISRHWKETKTWMFTWKKYGKKYPPIKTDSKNYKVRLLTLTKNLVHGRNKSTKFVIRFLRWINRDQYWKIK